MDALRWVWWVGLAAVMAAACFVAFLVACWVRDDPAHVWLAYLVGSSWFLDRAIDGHAEWEAKR